MANYREQLLSIILNFCLHFRNNGWNDIKDMIENNMLAAPFCQHYLADAVDAARIIEESGNWLYRPPQPEELFATGRHDLTLGRLLEGTQYEIGMQISGRPRNSLIVGAAGSGKTMTVINICLGIEKYNRLHPDAPVSLIIIDPKRDYCRLTQMLGPHWRYFSPQHGLRLGLNGPASVSPAFWLPQIATSLAARIGLVFSRSVLTQLILRLLSAMNPSPSPVLVYPSLATTLEAAKNKEIVACVSSKATYDQTLVQALEGFLHDSCDVFDCCNGFDASTLPPGTHAIIDVSNLVPSVRNFIVDLLVNQVMMLRLFCNIKPNILQVLFVLDESDLLISKKAEIAFPDGMSPLSLLCRLGRELGLGTIISISAIQHAVDYILSSCIYTYAFNTSDHESVRTLIQNLQIDRRCERLIASLEPGQCLFRQTQSSWPNSMLCQMNKVEIPGNHLTIQFTSHPYIPSKSLAQMPEVMRDLNKFIEEHRTTRKRQDLWFQSDIEKQALDFLKLAIEHPFIPAVRLFDKMGKPRFDIQKQIRGILEKKQLAKFEEIRIGSINTLLVDPTDAARKSMGTPVPQQKGRGSIAHRHFAHWIKQHYGEQGIPASIEATVPGTNHPCDVAVVKNHWHVFEICVTSHENMVSHIKECFEKATVVETMTVVAATKAQLKEIKTFVTDNFPKATFLEQIKYEMIQTYIPKENDL